MKKIWHHTLAFTFLLFLLTGCGFHLRGHEPLPPQLRIMYFEPNSPYTALTKELRHSLQSMKITLVDSAKQAPVTLKVISDKFNQAVTSVGASGQTSTYVITYTVTFQLLDSHGNPIIPTQTASSVHSYSIMTNQYLGGLSYQSSLQSQMQREAVYQILDRLRSYNTRQALQQIND